MNLLLYNLIIRLYNLLVFLFSLFNRRARDLIAGRRRAFQTIREKSTGNKRVIWFHCASLGEFEQGLPVMESIKSGYPEYLLYLSFFSPSGYEVQKNNDLADCVFYLPSDTKSNSERLLKLLNPAVVFFIKYEFWYHYLKACTAQNIPAISISTILRPDQLFFKFYGGFYRKILTFFNHFFVQNKETLELLKRLGLTNATLSGDTRFDRVNTISNRQSHIQIIEDFKGRKDLIVLGSTWKQDIDLWISYINGNPHLKYIIAPHHIAEENLKYIERKVLKNTIRFSRAEKDFNDTTVLIIDNIGMLSAIYRYADIAYVGGAFGEGLHNILEPATYGKPIIIGRADSNKKYQEVTALIDKGGAFEVKNTHDLETIMNDLLSDKIFFQQAGASSRDFVQGNLGSTDKIMKEVKRILS
jgi:3-deoxy-D-manno-octulosonic-acid transferase